MKRAQTRGSINLPVRETLESNSKRQSQEMFLMPRNCWLRVTSLEIQPEKLQTGQKLRIRISVPNSNRSIRSSLIPIDDSLRSSLSLNVDDNGYTLVTLDITATCEYRHDIRYGHPSNLEIELEFLTAIINRTKSMGTATIDLAKAIQAPVKGTAPLFHDGKKVATIHLQVYSLNISRPIPENVDCQEQLFLSDETSEIDSAPSESALVFTNAYESKRIALVDTSIREGEIFTRFLGSSDSVIAVSDREVINQFFQFASLRIEQGIPVVIIGNDIFVSEVLMRFLFMRDRGLLTNEAFKFFIVPLSTHGTSFADAIGQESVNYSRNFLSGEWEHIFKEDSDVQNAGQMIEDILSTLLDNAHESLDIEIAELQIMTSGNEKVMSMIRSLGINSPDAKKGLASVKASFTTTTATKNSSIKFTKMEITPQRGLLNVKWSEIASKLIPRPLSDVQYEEKMRTVIRMGVTTAKDKLALVVDGKAITGVIGFTISMRGPESAIKIWG